MNLAEFSDCDPGRCRLCRRASRGPDDAQDLIRFEGLCQDVMNSAGARERERLLFIVTCGAENNLGPRGQRIASKLPCEFVPVHLRHDHIGDHNIRAVRTRCRECFNAVTGFEHAVSSGSK